MGRRTILPSYAVKNTAKTSTVLDSASSFYTEETECDGVDMFTYDVVIDPTVVGTFVVQYSNEKFLNDAAWKPLVFSSAITVNGGTDVNHRIEIQVSFKRLRVSWTNNAGTGNISIKAFGLVKGA